MSMQPSYTNKVEILNSLEQRNANSTMMTDHIAASSHELLHSEDNLRKERSSGHLRK